MSTRRAAIIAFMMGFYSICEAGAPQLPPTPSDPKLAAAFEEAKAFVTKAQNPNYFEMPAAVQPWPCEVPDTQLRKLAWVLNEDEMDAKTKLAFRKSAMNAGMSSKDMQMSYRDATFAPLMAACKNGLLDGPLEFVVEYTRLMVSSASTMEIRMISRQSMTIAAGERVLQAPVLNAVLAASTKITYKDPATQAMMAKLKIPQSKSLSVSYVLPQTEDDFYVTTITDAGAQGYMTMFQRPTGPNRSEMTLYMGSTLHTLTPMKNRLPHGEQRVAEQKYGTVIVPAKSTCYEDGEIILTTKCDVQ
jgi:hypothetical protein